MLGVQVQMVRDGLTFEQSPERIHTEMGVERSGQKK